MCKLVLKAEKVKHFEVILSFRTIFVRHIAFSRGVLCKLQNGGRAELFNIAQN
jgi:hypothetical protein